MANPIESAHYQLFTIKKGDKEYKIQGKVTGFDYYESLLSPNITAILEFVDTGGSVQYDSEYDKQERFGTIYNALPLTGDGTEEIRFKISSELGSLDFSNTPLYVNGCNSPDKQSNVESVYLSLVSKSAIKNQESVVNKTYKDKISNSVALIMKNILGLNPSKIFIDETSNTYPFIGNNKSPFDILIMLASKSIPIKGNPGFFFYETKNGHQFRSIDNLISQQPVNKGKPYVKNEHNKSSANNDNSFQINLFSINKNQNLINALKSGVYSNRTILWNPKTFKEEEVSFVLGDKELITSLGKREVVKKDNNQYTRTLYSIKDVGTLSPSIKETVSSKPQQWQGKVQMRYNLLFTQVGKIQVPLNPNLNAGDVIDCDFEVITRSEKEQGIADPVQSGKYLILDLCHHFEPNRNYTAMTIVRDTYGKYVKEN